MTQRRAVAVADGEAPAPPPFAPSAQIGAGAPLGFFDPLGFTEVGDEAGFRKLRAAELKHGRVAMMASVGLLGQHFIKFPGFEKAPAGFKVMNTGEGVLGFTAILVVSGIIELAWRENEDKEPGNFGDPFGVKMYTEEMRNKEINNGRFAMICVLAIFAAEMATGKDAIQQFGLAAIGERSFASPRSAFAGTSAGAVAPRASTQRMALEGAAVAVANAEAAPPPPPFAPSEQVG